MNYPLPVPTNRMNKADSAALEAAVAALEKTSFAKKLAHLAGRQIGFAGRIMPAKLQQVSAIAARRALFGAMNFALASLKGKPVADTRRRHQRLAMVSGAVGGALGLASLPVELPISTTIMLRAIADIARAEGRSFRSGGGDGLPRSFALGGHGEDEKSWRGAISRYAACSPSRCPTRRPMSPKRRRLGVGARPRPLDRNDLGAFGVVVSQKTAAQAAPVIGAISGAVINLAFTEHFQTLARGHFIVRRLEREFMDRTKCGPNTRASPARPAIGGRKPRERLEPA